MELFKGFHLIHGLILVIMGIFNLWFWMRRGFWVPKYVHFIAAGGLIIGLYFAWLGYSESGNRDPWFLAWVVLLFPTLVYVCFVFLGGVEAAVDSRTTAPHYEDDNEV